MNFDPVYHWEGEVGDFAEVLRDVSATEKFQVDGTIFRMPGRADYERAFRESGILPSEAPLASAPELVAVAQAHWHAEGHNACVFAQHMSGTRDVTGWETFVLADHGDPGQDAAAIYHIVSPRLIAAEAEVVSVILPHADSDICLASLAQRLGAMPGWAMTEEGVERDPELGDLRLIGLRVDVEFGFVAEVLGFGPFPSFGNTRRSPFTELAIRVKEPRKLKKEERAFMAQVEIPGLDLQTHGQWWAQTRINRSARLGTDHDERAKARMTFALPTQAFAEGDA